MLLNNPKQRFEEFYQVYEEAFPAVERRTKEGQRAAADREGYRLRVVEENGVIIAFLSYWELDSCTFLEHLATTPACRGKGIGKALLEECLLEAKKPVFLEIEPVTAEDEMTGRRAGFYQRTGFFLNDFPYLQMPLKEGDSPIPLKVMSYPEAISEEEFLPYKKEIYLKVYQVGE